MGIQLGLLHCRHGFKGGNSMSSRQRPRRYQKEETQSSGRINRGAIAKCIVAVLILFIIYAFVSEPHNVFDDEQVIAYRAAEFMVFSIISLMIFLGVCLAQRDAKEEFSLKLLILAVVVFLGFAFVKNMIGDFEHQILTKTEVTKYHFFTQKKQILPLAEAESVRIRGDEEFRPKRVDTPQMFYEIDFSGYRHASFEFSDFRSADDLFALDEMLKDLPKEIENEEDLERFINSYDFSEEELSKLEHMMYE